MNVGSHGPPYSDSSGASQSKRTHDGSKLRMRDDSAFNKACIVSPGLERKRVSSFIAQTGARHVLLVYFGDQPASGSSSYPGALLAQLAKVREELRKDLLREVPKVEEIKCPELSVDAVAAFTLALAERLRKEGVQRISVGLGSGHTLFKLGAFIAASLDGSIDLKYGHAYDYLEIHAVKVAKVVEGMSQSDLARLGPLEAPLRELLEFARDGGSGQTVVPAYVQGLTLPPLQPSDLDVLTTLVSSGGACGSYAELGRLVNARNSHWVRDVQLSRGLKATPGATSTQNARTCIRELRSHVLVELEARGLLTKTKGEKEVQITITDLGRYLETITLKKLEVQKKLG